jgi:hypothetical protein
MTAQEQELSEQIPDVMFNQHSLNNSEKNRMDKYDLHFKRSFEEILNKKLNDS